VKLLALEAGGPVLGAALFEGERVVGQAHVSAPQRQTESLAPLVQGLLAAHGWSVKDLGALACGVGPGSFTGLRSSLAFGRGLALGAPGLRLLGVPTLEAWAEAFSPPSAGQAWVLLDGRRGQVYRGAYTRTGRRWIERSAPALLPLAEARPLPPEPVLSDLGGEAGLPAETASPALALAVGRLALAALADGAPAADWEPRYLRRSEAEILWERLHPPVPKA
jgi:tRNA threonylcarbamoyladenosine biosynthesis protein TsaB